LPVTAETVGALLGAEVTRLERLSGGASRETWAVDTADHELILQQRRPGAGAANVPMRTEVALLRAAAAAGVPVPAVVADATESGELGAPALVVERLPGETIARKLLRDDRYAAVRPRLAAACGSTLAAIHRIPPAEVPDLTTTDPLESMRAALDGLGEPHPAIELGLRWLDTNRPPASSTPAVVHGDFRTGNLLVTPEGLAAVLDWELAHLGDPLEDLGWFCVRAWRFGEVAKPAGGFGTREDLWRAYEEAGGAPVDPSAARWWEVYGTLRWGVICIMQAASHRLGLARSMELAAIGRRTCENEHDLLALLPGGPMPDATAVEPVDSWPPHDRPSGAELAEAVREWVETDVAGATDGRVRFHTRVAGNVLAIIERELRFGPAHAEAHRRRLDRLGFDDDAALAAAVRAGSVDDRFGEVRAEVWASVRDKLAVAHPGYDDQLP
jgi:aminoglycoside phosphotransferase (APT) family kinase protein